MFLKKTVRFDENVHVVEVFVDDSPVIDRGEEKIPSQFRKHSIYLTLIFASLFIIFDLILPLYNKSLYAGFGSKGGFHYPVTTSLIQVGCTSLCLLIAVVFNWIIKKWLGLPHPYFIFSGGFKQFFLKV